MPGREHVYEVRVKWSGNLGRGTSAYHAYSRDYEIRVADRAVIAGSADRAFRGDAERYNPEELLVSALLACHMLSYLHLCADAGIVVLTYRDSATGIMRQRPDGAGGFQQVTLQPIVGLAAGADREQALRLHERAHELCFIANSVNFPVLCQPTALYA